MTPVLHSCMASCNTVPAWRSNAVDNQSLLLLLLLLSLCSCCGSIPRLRDTVHRWTHGLRTMDGGHSNVNADTSNTRVSGYHWTRINGPHHNHGKHYPCSRCVSHVWQDLNKGDSTLRRCHLHLCFTLWNDCSYKDLFEPICPYFLCGTFSYNSTFHLKYCQT